MSLYVDVLLVLDCVLIFLLAGYEWLTLVGFPSLQSETSAADHPMVSIILPVKNQANTVEECLRSLVALNYPNKEIIVVEGSSSDETHDVVLKFADKVKIIEEEPLPEGWVGKNWACHLGRNQATGELFLFTDADSIHSTDSLERTVACLQTSGASLVTLAPQTILRTFWEKVLQPPVFLLIMLSVGGKWVNDDTKHNSIGNGQYMLITHQAYQMIGGHEGVRDRIVEDLGIAKKMKKSGLKIRFLAAQDAFGVRMYSSLKEIWIGWRKNFYTASDTKRLSRAILRLLVMFTFFIQPFLVLGAGILLLVRGTPLNAYLIAGTFMCFWLWLGTLIFYKQGARLNPAYGLLLPLAIAIYMGIGIDSTIRGALGMGLSWKGRVYGKTN